MKRLRISPTVRAALIASAFAASLLLALAGVALAAGGSVSIVEASNRYEFHPGDINVTRGSTVTWTDNSDAHHTISSDASGGPLSGSVSPGGTYQAMLDTVGDFAYHCNIHTYMHGTVHVAALPPSDTVTASSNNTGLLVGLAGVGSLLLITGLGLRLRRVEERP